MSAISSYRGNRPTNKQIHKQTGAITIHCAAASLARSVKIYLKCYWIEKLIVICVNSSPLNQDVDKQFVFIALQHAFMHTERDIILPILSVLPVPVLCQNELTCRHTV